MPKNLEVFPVNDRFLTKYYVKFTTQHTMDAPSYGWPLRNLHSPWPYLVLKSPKFQWLKLPSLAMAGLLYLSSDYVICVEYRTTMHCNENVHNKHVRYFNYNTSLQNYWLFLGQGVKNAKIRKVCAWYLFKCL